MASDTARDGQGWSVTGFWGGSHLAEDLLSVRLQLSTQLHPGQVGLQQQVGLHVGVVEFGVGQFVGHLLGQLGVEGKPSVLNPQKQLYPQGGGGTEVLGLWNERGWDC